MSYPQDLITLLSRLARGSQADKLHWIFSLYDLNGDGRISREEMTEVVRAVYDLLGRHTDLPIDDTTVQEKVDASFSVSIMEKIL